METKLYEINIEEGLPDIDAALRTREYRFASAAAVILLLVVLIFTLLELQISKKRVVY